MKQIKYIWAIVAVIAAVLAIALKTQCASELKPCNLPAPRVVRVDSFPNGTAYVSWSQVVGNNGYRIRVLRTDSSATVLRDTSVGINDTNIVITNLPVNTLLEFQVSAKCPDGNSSTNIGTKRSVSIVIADEIVMTRCPQPNESPCDVMDDTDGPIIDLSQSGKYTCDIPNFISSVGNKHFSYHIVIKDDNTNIILSEFRLLYGLGQNGAIFGIEGSCGSNPPQRADFDGNNKYEWFEPNNSPNKMRFIINSDNSVTLETDETRNYTIKKSTSYTTTCK